MRRRAYVLALVLALGAAVPVSAQPNDVSTASQEVRQLLAAAQKQIAAGDFESARATLDSIPSLGPTSQQEASFLF
jgi:Tfp pilus assembly protein PilF